MRTPPCRSVRDGQAEVTKEMLQAAMRKATEAGLLPRNGSAAEVAINTEIVQAILQAALDAVTVQAKQASRK